ncbi:MAG: hypothetical protein PVI01_06115 [Gemmatimonadales bacterium]|jgi:hypothetical protein
MKSLRLTCVSLALTLLPTIVFAQAGETPLAVSPIPLGLGGLEFRGYVTIEDEIDLFGVYRQGIGRDVDFGLRAGYSDVWSGGFHFGGDLRYGLPWGRGTELRYAAAVGLQFTLADLGNILSVPFGVSIGSDVGTVERPVMLFGLPYFTVNRYDPDGASANTELEFGVELGGEVTLTDVLIFNGVLTIASNDDSNIELALGLIYRR